MIWRGLFFRATSLLILSLLFEGERGKQPGWFSLESVFPGMVRIRFAGKGLIGKVPEAFFPLLLGFLHLVLHLLLCCLYLDLRSHDHPPFLPLRQFHRAFYIVP